MAAQLTDVRKALAKILGERIHNDVMSRKYGEATEAVSCFPSKLLSPEL